MKSYMPFDIKYRKQIENGDYHVVTKEYVPVRIVCWDASENMPIVGIVTEDEGHNHSIITIPYFKDGTHTCGTTKYDLMIEKKDVVELNEFECEVNGLLKAAMDKDLYVPNTDDVYDETKFEDIKKFSKHLLETARRMLTSEEKDIFRKGIQIPKRFLNQEEREIWHRIRRKTNLSDYDAKVMTFIVTGQANISPEYTTLADIMRDPDDPERYRKA